MGGQNEAHRITKPLETAGKETPIAPMFKSPIIATGMTPQDANDSVVNIPAN